MSQPQLDSKRTKRDDYVRQTRERISMAMAALSINDYEEAHFALCAAQEFARRANNMNASIPVAQRYPEIHGDVHDKKDTQCALPDGHTSPCSPYVKPIPSSDEKRREELREVVRYTGPAKIRFTAPDNSVGNAVYSAAEFARIGLYYVPNFQAVAMTEIVMDNDEYVTPAGPFASMRFTWREHKLVLVVAPVDDVP